MLLRVMLSGQFPIVKQQTFVYQAANATSGLTVVYQTFRPDGAEDINQSGVAEEVGVTGRYLGRVTTDRPGWFVVIHDSANGEAVRRFD